MLSKCLEDPRNQLEVIALDQLVPDDHLVRKIEAAIDFDFIYPLVEEMYSRNNDCPIVDPVVLIKMVAVQYLFGIHSIRQTIKEIETNVAYRWFLGYGFPEKTPHFSTFCKNYIHRFKETDLFEQVFYRILNEAMNKGFVDLSIAFIDSTDVKVNVNKKEIHSTRKSFGLKRAAIRRSWMMKSKWTVKNTKKNRFPLKRKKRRKKLKSIEWILKVAITEKCNFTKNLLKSFYVPDPKFICILVFQLSIIKHGLVAQGSEQLIAIR
jgi:transposase